MRYISTSEAAKNWDISPRRVAKLASEGRIKNAVLCGSRWMIPENASKPNDGRKKSGDFDAGERYVFPDLIFWISAASPPESLPPDEKMLYDGIMQYEKNEYSECIRILSALLQSTNRQCLIIGAHLYLQYAYAANRNFESAVETLALLRKELDADVDHREEMLLIKRVLDSYLTGLGTISKPLNVDICYDYSRGCLPYLAGLTAYSDLFSLFSGKARNAIASHEIICMELENQGYDYAACLIHLYIAIMCSYGADEKRDLHLRKSFDLVLKHEYYASFAVFLGFFPDLVPLLRQYYSAESVDMIVKCARTRLHTSTAFFQFIGVAPIHQKMAEEDYFLLACMGKGYSIRQIAELCFFSASTVKKRLNKLYGKLNVKNKKELLTKYNREIMEMGSPAFVDAGGQ